MVIPISVGVSTAAGRSSQESTAERTNFRCDELHLRRNYGRNQRLEAGDRLRRLDVVLLVLLDVRLVQFVHQPGLGVDQGVDFLLRG